MDMKDLMSKKKPGGKAVPVRPAAAKLNAALDRAIGSKDKTSEHPQEPELEVSGSAGAGGAAPALDLPPVSEMAPISLEDILAGKFDERYIYDGPIDWIDGNDKELTYNREEDEKDVDTSDLEEDMKINGQIEPGYVRPNQNGLLQIEQGWRRYLTAKKLGFKTYRFVVTKDSDYQAAFKSISLNLNRRDIPDYFKILKIKQFSEKFEKTYEQIGRETGFGKKSYVSQLMQMANFPLVLAALKEKKFTSYQGMKICQKIKKEGLDEKKILKLIDLVHKKSVSTDELAYLDLDKPTKAKEKNEKKGILQNGKGGVFSVRFNFDPKKTSTQEIEKAVDSFKGIIENLKQALRNKKNEEK